jgi:hypothetical protein
MRLVLPLMAVMLAPPCHAQQARHVDLLELTPGRAFPLPAAFPVDPGKESLPFYSFTVPLATTSRVNAFVEYDVDVMLDTKTIYALRAKRTFPSIVACRQAKDSVIHPLTETYQLVPVKSSGPMFEASRDDLRATLGCYVKPGSPYPTLDLYLYSHVQRERFREQMKKKFGR